MWALVNQTPFAAERNWVRDKNGVHHWLVAVRATFIFNDGGGLAPADEQPPPALEPQYFGEPGLSSLRYDSDLLALKPGTDVVLDAYAHAPGGRPVRSVTTSLGVGDHRKTIVVHGERRYTRNLMTGGVAVTDPEPFVSRPIRYENAYGGWDQADPDPRQQRMDARNPIGCGVALREERLVECLAPTVQYPDGDIAKRGPAGFGPIDAAWSPRRELAGTYDDAWSTRKRPLLPDDYDDRFGLSAPADQQVIPHLRGGERIELSNLSHRGSLAFALPRHYFVFTTRFGSKRQEHRARMATVFIEPEALRVSLVWQASLPVRPPDIDYLDATEIGEKEYVR
jgi:hypothetical protein